MQRTLREPRSASTGVCPDCDAQIGLSRPRLGQKILCPYCDTQLEVIALEPLELDWAMDWPDEDEWYEEREAEGRE